MKWERPRPTNAQGHRYDSGENPQEELRKSVKWERSRPTNDQVHQYDSDGGSEKWDRKDLNLGYVTKRAIPGISVYRGPQGEGVLGVGLRHIDCSHVPNDRYRRPNPST